MICPRGIRKLKGILQKLNTNKLICDWIWARARARAMAMAGLGGCCCAGQEVTSLGFWKPGPWGRTHLSMPMGLSLSRRPCRPRSRSPLVRAVLESDTSRETESIHDLDWDNLGFKLHATDKMFIMKCHLGEKWDSGELLPYGSLQLTPSAGVLNYGQGLLEGMKAYKTEDDRILLFRPEENALRMIAGADRLCMPAPSLDAFVEAVKLTVGANERWIPPPGKGSLYIRPLLFGSGPVLSLAPAPEYMFVIYVSPVGNYFKEGLSPIHLKVETNYHRASPGGTGGIKTIGNYASVLKTQLEAKKQGFSDVIYLDAVGNQFLEQVSSCNIFVVKGEEILTPETQGTILPGITRKSIVELARSRGYKVHERPVSIQDLIEADEVFCTGTAVVVSPVGSVTYNEERTSYADGGLGKVSRELYTALISMQMGTAADTMGWTSEV